MAHCAFTSFISSSELIWRVSATKFVINLKHFASLLFNLPYVGILIRKRLFLYFFLQERTNLSWTCIAETLCKPKATHSRLCPAWGANPMGLADENDMRLAETCLHLNLFLDFFLCLYHLAAFRISPPSVCLSLCKTS